MSKTMIVGARIWDAGGGAPFDGDVLVEGNRVRAVSRAYRARCRSRAAR